MGNTVDGPQEDIMAMFELKYQSFFYFAVINNFHIMF